MTEDDVDALIAPLYARGQIARDEAWRAFEATLGELRASLLAQARFVGSFGHLATQAVTTAHVAEQTLRQSMPEPPSNWAGQSLSEEDEAFERRLAFLRQGGARPDA